MYTKWIIRLLLFVVLIAGMGGKPARAYPTSLLQIENDSSARGNSIQSLLSSTTITIPGAQITSLAVYETGNKIFVADDNSQSVKVFSGANNALLTTIPNVGGAVFDMVVNETYGKVFAASDKACCTTGITPGNGLISVINATTHQVITQINPGPQGGISYFLLGSDEVHDKIYLSFSGGIGVIDAATNTYTLIPGTSGPYAYLKKIGINTATNRIYLPTLNSGLTVINGNNLSVQTLAYPANSGQALDVAVNEVENKVYVTMVTVPNQGTMGIYILDRDTGEHWFVGASDLEPLAFDNTHNLLFTGVQVGTQAAIVDGETNQLSSINLGTGSIFDIEVREPTNRAYLVSREYTIVLSGETKAIYDKIASNLPPAGGLFFETVEINQKNGKVYVVNDGDIGTITVFQDPYTFQDVPPEHWAWMYIERLYKAGITGGCQTSPVLLYCPGNTVNRAQMAVFLLRGIHGSSYTPPDVNGDSGFLDVPADSPSAPWIKQLAAEGITGGCGNGNYCPNSPVSRAQMAIFLLRAEHGSDYVPPDVHGDSGFDDILATSAIAPWVKQLVTEGITAGCGGGNYCPNNSVTRDQMAVFLVRTFNLP